MNTFKLSFFPRYASLVRTITTHETDPEVISSAIQTAIDEAFFEFKIIKSKAAETCNYSENGCLLSQLHEIEESTIEVLDFEIFVGDFISVNYKTLNGLRLNY